jgi:sulfite dehydrogenase (quinone) subunit SoeC
VKPALSVIFFTVISGGGLGVLALVALVDLMGGFELLRFPVGSTPEMTYAAEAGIAFAVAGLWASALHLANPRNAWRAYSRFRTSWLSREAVFALAFLAVAAIYAAMLATGANGVARMIVAIALIVLALTVLTCTAMIYASLKPIRQWHTRWTPAVYLTLGLWSGAVLLRALLRDVDGADALWPFAAALGILGTIVKAAYWRRIDGATDSIALEQAIGVDHGVRPPSRASGATIMRARLLDAGHTHGTFLTDEFGFVLARRHRRWLRLAFWIGGIAIPLVWILFGRPDVVGALVANVACIGGLLAERWLFFAEARHTVRLYHGDART